MKYVDLKSTDNKGVKRPGAEKKSCLSYFPAVFVAAVVIVAALNVGKIKTALANVLNPISVVSSVTGVSRGGKLKEDDGRTNILLLGSDQRSFGDQLGSQLTDTIMILSVGRAAQDVVLISVPRDLRVQSSTGGYLKINELYGFYGGKDATGTQEILKAVGDVLGIPIHYYGVINFDLFEGVISTLGSIDVNVENSFEDYEYPVEGRESDACGRSEKEIKEMEDKGQSYLEIFPCRYEHLKFVKGLTKMDGETALKYSRSRHGDNGENTDFARAKRQQSVIMAVKQKALSPQTLLDFSKIKSLYELYAQNVDTNLDISSLQLFYTLAQSMQLDNIRTLVLDDRSEGEDGGLLYAPTDLTLYGGKYVLIPKAGDYSQIHAYIQKYLFD